MAKYIIKDWAGNVCFFGQEFTTFEDAWAHIYEQHPEDTADEDGTFDEYEVVEA